MTLDPKTYGLTDEQARTVETLSQDQLRYAYALQRRLLLTEDAERHAEALLACDQERLDKLSPDDFETMASRFEDEYNAGITENDLWDEIVWDHSGRKEAGPDDA